MLPPNYWPPTHAAPRLAAWEMFRLGRCAAGLAGLVVVLVEVGYPARHTLEVFSGAGPDPLAEDCEISLANMYPSFSSARDAAVAIGRSEWVAQSCGPGGAATKVEPSRWQVVGERVANCSGVQRPRLLGCEWLEVALIASSAGESHAALLVDADQTDHAAGLEAHERRVELGDAVHQLDQRAQTVIALYYGDKLTFTEIGRVLGLTKSRA